MPDSDVPRKDVYDVKSMVIFFQTIHILLFFDVVCHRSFIPITFCITSCHKGKYAIALVQMKLSWKIVVKMIWTH